MKKYVLLGCLLLSPLRASAEGQFGIELSPSISFGRVYTSPDNKGFGGASVSLASKVGFLFDYAFRDNYFVSTGLLLSFQQISIRNPQHNLDEEHALHYLQCPIGLKLYTSEVTLDTRLYVKFGGIFQILINHRNTHLPESVDDAFMQAFRRWGIAGTLGIGAEYDLSLTTSLFAGISYQLGLTNVVTEHRNDPPAPQLTGYSDLISIDVGLRF